MDSGGLRDCIIELSCWIVLAVVGAITVTQAFGWAGSRMIAVIQSLTPYLGLLLVPVILLALWRGNFVMVTVAAATGFGLLVLATPLIVPNPQQAPIEGSTGLRVASLNLWYENTNIGAVDKALAAVEADVIVFNEYTAEHQAVLTASALADNYPHRLDVADRGATGIALWSRYPIERHPELDTFDDSLNVTVAAPDGKVHIVAMHLTTPIVDFDGWRRDIHIVEEVGRTATVPTLVVGDLNSTYWHPDFRRLLDAGFVDAHIAARHGFSTSWPMNWPIPPFVRLDRALTIGGLVSTDIDDFEVPGSDHRGLVVTVAPTLPAMP